jgi:hypothetical protein
MTLRKWAYEQVTGLPGLGIPAARVYSSGSVGETIPGDSPSRPFAVIRLAPEIPGLLPGYPVHQRRFGVWIHDDPGTMEKLDAAAKIIKDGLHHPVPVMYEGIFIMDCVWEGTSEDFYDDHFLTNVVRVDFLLTHKLAP